MEMPQEEKKGPPIAIIVGTVITCIVFTTIFVYAVRDKNSID
tara:strand:+ start:147 stop:272 length:126 start_codon:yes stop_codon:yes gene_type:complete